MGSAPALMQDESKRQDGREHESGNGEHIAQVVPQKGNIAPGNVEGASRRLCPLRNQPRLARVNRGCRSGNLHRLR